MKLSNIFKVKMASIGHSSVASTATSRLQTILHESLESTKAAGTWKSERVILGRQGPLIAVEGQKGPILNFCANNYLGLSSHPKVIEAAQNALRTHGSGLSSVRFICGTTDLHLELEEKLAKFHNRESAILYGSCFDANGGIFEALLTEEDAVLSDELNHASIIDGLRLCKARKWRYLNRDMEDLRRCLQEASSARMRMIVTDGAFSMDGSIAPLKDISRLAAEHDALLFVDDCHGTGCLGASGRGTEEHCGLPASSVDVINSTLGKALGGASGGYTVGPSSLISLLRQRSRPYLFSNSLPPPVVAAAIAAIDLVDSGGLLESLVHNTASFRARMTDLGFHILGDAAHPICPVMLGDARLATTFANEMLKRGVYVVGFSFPVVAKGKARIRVQMSACHGPDQIDKAVLAFKEVGQMLAVIGVVE